MIPFNKKNSRGFALLIATLVSSLFLAIGAVIFQIAYVEFLLSSIGRDSQFAFYAADTGAECALYWDRKFSQGDSSGSAFSLYDEAGNGDDNQANRYKIFNNTYAPIDCAGTAITPILSYPACRNPANSVAFCQGTFDAGTFESTYFKFPVADSAGINRGCVEVVVTKDNGGQPAALFEPTKTTIVSRGYNTCNVTSDRRVERAIQVTLE